jgi:hypothetical protein
MLAREMLRTSNTCQIMVNTCFFVTMDSSRADFIPSTSGVLGLKFSRIYCRVSCANASVSSPMNSSALYILGVFLASNSLIAVMNKKITERRTSNCIKHVICKRRSTVRSCNCSQRQHLDIWRFELADHVSRV